LEAARAAIDAGADLTVPLHLRNEAFSGAKALGYGRGYKYAHDYPDNFVEQDYTPESLKGIRIYNPSSNGYESQISDLLARLRGRPYDDSDSDDEGARK
jgi:putative ATPase